MGIYRRNTHTMPICRPNIHDFHQNSKPLLSINRYLFTCVESELIRDFQIISLEVGRCRGQLHRRRTSDGPFRCTHGVALTLFAETVAGLAVFSRLGPKGKGILLKTETEYVKKAKGKKDGRGPLISGSVTGFAAFDPDEKDHILEHVKCDVILKDSIGEIVARVPTRYPFAIQKANTQCVLTFKVEGMELHNMRA